MWKLVNVDWLSFSSKILNRATTVFTADTTDLFGRRDYYYYYHHYEPTKFDFRWSTTNGVFHSRYRNSKGVTGGVSRSGATGRITYRKVRTDRTKLTTYSDDRLVPPRP